MEALGQLTGGIAHDFNNLLMIVSGYAQILERRLREPEGHSRDRGDPCRRRPRRTADAAVAHFLPAPAIDAGRGRICASGSTRCATCWRRRSAAISILFVTSRPISGRSRPISANWNWRWSIMAVNARDAMPEGGTLTLSARNVVLKPGSAAGALTGDFVALAIIDTGTGIPPDKVARVFEPFFTTKAGWQGHRSRLVAGARLCQPDRRRGDGFKRSRARHRRHHLSAARARRGARKPPARDPRPRTCRRTAPCCWWRTAARWATLPPRCLNRSATAWCGPRTRPRRCAICSRALPSTSLFSDIVMPGALDGLGLAELCRERFPDIPVLLTSGFSEAAQAADGRFDILRKPFELSALEQAIVQALSRARETPRRSATR